VRKALPFLRRSYFEGLRSLLKTWETGAAHKRELFERKVTDLPHIRRQSQNKIIRGGYDKLKATKESSGVLVDGRIIKMAQ